jgi:transcriptional regulator
MYIPKPFEIVDENTIDDFIRANAFGQLISQHENKPFCTHLPFLLAEDNQHLLVHMARQNPQWTTLAGQQVLVTFQGPHDYISPSWYQKSGVPTWNYQAVHVYGQAEIIEQPQQLASLVESLTERYEQKQASPWRASYPSNMLKAIVAIKIHINEKQAKFKLGQNRGQKDMGAVAEKLQDTNPLLSKAIDDSM